MYSQIMQIIYCIYKGFIIISISTTQRVADRNRTNILVILFVIDESMDIKIS